MTVATILVVVLLGGAPTQSLDFDTQIVPILTKAGCNAGACHGSAAGRGGFRLSLLGGDPASDHESITQELKGRRIDLVRPRESLLLAKPTGLLSHGGTFPWTETAPTRIGCPPGSPPAPPGKTTPIDPLRGHPDRCVIEEEGVEVPLKASARFDDGPPEEVTPWTVFTPADPGAVEIDADAARATIRRRGPHVVIARFLDRVVPLRLTLPLSETPTDLSRERRANFIDDEILKSLAVLRLPVSPGADDATFLRRVRLDLTGRLPDRDEVESFRGPRAR
ncbi:MAG: DUF1549 domain-containing protein [Singulisphaera sp.]